MHISDASSQPFAFVGSLEDYYSFYAMLLFYRDG